MKLSICMMVKDEEQNLKRCLDNLKPIVDRGLAELIIVDTGSTDDTVNIARKYTTKVYFHKWEKNFSDMRNVTISYATGEWIFIIDADERLDDIDQMIDVLENDTLQAYNTGIIQVKNLDSYEDESKYNIMPSPRLFRNDGEFGYVGTVHNQPLSKKPELNIDICLTHYGYISTDEVLMEKKYKRTVELLKLELEKDSNNLYYLYQLGVSYDMHKDFKPSLEVFRKAYRIMNEKRILNDLDYVYIQGSYARICFTNGEFNECFDIISHVLKVQPEYIDMYYILGLVQKRRGNLEQAYQAFKKYIELAGRYSELEIAKDLSIIMYHINDVAISVANSEIIAYHIKKDEYKMAYKLLNSLKLVEHKIYYTPKILLKLKKYDEVSKAYYQFEKDKERNAFLIEIENSLDELSELEVKSLYKVFNSNNDLYGKYSLMKNSSSRSKKKEIAQTILAEIDFNVVPQFYAQLLFEVEEINSTVVNALGKAERIVLDNLIQYLIEKKCEFKLVLEEYLNTDILKWDTLEILKVQIGILKVLLLVNLKEKKDIDEYYEGLFHKYVNLGISFVEELYQMEKAELIYKSINTVEERFFMQMYLANKNVVTDKKKVIQYILEAVKTYEAMAKYIDLYKNTLLQVETEEEKNAKAFESYKNQIKQNISGLVADGNIPQARALLDEYKSIVPDDIDNYSIEGVICIFENKLNEAEQILDMGLKKMPYHTELLANKAYLMDSTGRNNEAIENIVKAKLFNEDNNIKVRDIIRLDNIETFENPRVIHGTIEIANQMNNLTCGLKKMGIDAKGINYWPNYLGYKSEISMDMNQFSSFEQRNSASKEIAAKMISENDVFHFHFGSTLTFDYSDLPLLNELGKKVVMQYWGSDVRLYSKAVQMNPYAKVKNMDEDSIKRQIEAVSKHVSNCLVDYELGEYVKGYFDNIHYTRVAMDLNKYKCMEKTNNKKLLIVHAPTSPEIKGSAYILAAIEKLKEEYDFEFKLVQGMPHSEAIKIYEKADLIIDQVIMGSYGVFAVEAMAMGKPVICWISDFMKEKYPKELPIIIANPDNIKEKIEYAIKNSDMLPHIGAKGRAYVEKYHDMNNIAKEMLQLYRSI